MNSQMLPEVPTAYTEFNAHVTRQLEFYYAKRKQLEDMQQNCKHTEAADFIRTQLNWVEECINILNNWDNRAISDTPVNPSKY